MWNIILHPLFSRNWLVLCSLICSLPDLALVHWYDMLRIQTRVLWGFTYELSKSVLKVLILDLSALDYFSSD